MKKLLSAFCCILYLHSISQSPLDVRVSSPKTSGEKVLIKALAVIVNPKGKKKGPVKKIELSASESPWI
jgi:predicted metalloenzyme YecM